MKSDTEGPFRDELPGRLVEGARASKGFRPRLLLLGATSDHCVPPWALQQILHYIALHNGDRKPQFHQKGRKRNLLLDMDEELVLLFLEAELGVDEVNVVDELGSNRTQCRILCEQSHNLK